MSEPIPETVRLAVYRRDYERCRMCGKNLHGSWFSIHHIFYRSEGGTNDLDNLILLCGSGSNGCHLAVHSDKDLYQPLLLELLKKPGITGIALLRRKNSELDYRLGGSRVPGPEGNRKISRFTSDANRAVHTLSDREPQPG